MRIINQSGRCPLVIPIKALEPRAKARETRTGETKPRAQSVLPKSAVSDPSHFATTPQMEWLSKADSTTTRSVSPSFDFSRLSVRAMAKTIQPKLTVSESGDAAEQEADQVADQIMRMPDHRVATAPSTEIPANLTLQRMCQECETQEDEELQGKGAESENDEIDGHVASEIQHLHDGGSALPNASRAFFEPRFGHDFAAVRVHTDSHAARLARSLNARAFTVGRDIVFGSGEYSPESGSGRRLLAHELTHVIQQRATEPQIQRLTVTQHSYTKGTCGARNVEWVFSLDKPAPEDGYIVQQIDKTEFVATCPNVAFGPAAPIPPFWEAWFVKKGDKVDWTTVRDKWTDGNTRPARPNTNGTDTAAGTIKFFKKSTTGDLGDYGVAPADPKSPWGPGKVKSSGALPSTSKEPSWWSGAAEEGPAVRDVTAYWDCCDPDPKKHTYDLKVKP